MTEHTPRLCREHGEQKAGWYLLKTLILGWWGVISFFTNFGAISADISALFAYRRLEEPTGEIRVHGPSAAQLKQKAARWRVLKWLTVVFLLLVAAGVAVTMLTITS